MAQFRSPISTFVDDKKIKIITVHDLKFSHFFPKKTAKKFDNLETFTHFWVKIPFLDYHKTKKAKSVTIWGHGLYFSENARFQGYKMNITRPKIYHTSVCVAQRTDWPTKQARLLFQYNYNIMPHNLCIYFYKT